MERTGIPLLVHCSLIFNSPDLCVLIKLFRAAVGHYKQNGKISRRFHMVSTINFLKLIYSLESFYELRTNAGPGAKDRRLDLFVKLKGRLTKGYVFLERRTRPLAPQPKRKNPQKRKHVKGKKPEFVKRRAAYSTCESIEMSMRRMMDDSF